MGVVRSNCNPTPVGYGKKRNADSQPSSSSRFSRRLSQRSKTESDRASQLKSSSGIHICTYTYTLTQCTYTKHACKFHIWDTHFYTTKSMPNNLYNLDRKTYVLIIHLVVPLDLFYVQHSSKIQYFILYSKSQIYFENQYVNFIVQ